MLLTIIFLRLGDLKNEDRRLPLKAKLKQMDFLGATLLVAAVTCLLLALQWGGATYPWRSSIVIGLFLGAGSLLAAFSLLQIYLGENSTIPPRIFLQRSVFTGSFYIFFLNMSNYIVSQTAPLHPQFCHLKPANVRLGRILFTILLPSGSGCISYKKWYTIHSSGLSRNLCHHSYGGAHQQAGILCEYPSTRSCAGISNKIRFPS